ncbi:reverse transcriptase, partial [Operophtera brumata]
FLKINSVSDEKKSGILLTHLTEETYRLVLNLAFPKELEALSYKDLVDLLDGHFKPKKCSFVDKAKFFGANRKSGETLGEWAARLRGLATYCEFGTALETNLRDRFVLGLGAGPERDKLFEQSPSTLTLTRAIELAEQAACAKEAKIMLCTSNDAISIKEEPVYRARFQGQSGRGRGERGAGGGVGQFHSPTTTTCTPVARHSHRKAVSPVATTSNRQVFGTPALTETDEAHVAPDVESVTDDGDAEQWSDCEANESEGGTTENAAAPEAQPGPLVPESEPPRSSLDVPSAPSPAPPRHRRVAKKVDYKQYF